MTLSKLFVLIYILLILVIGISMKAEAALQNLGTDNIGNRLIYDTDLDITWYDYSNVNNTWQNQMSWAGGLSVNFGGNVYDDWRLPTAVDGTNVLGYDGTTARGYNITSGEMGYLFYNALGNTGLYDTTGAPLNCPLNGPLYNCLTNTGDFQNLKRANYWSSTEYSLGLNSSWRFYTGTGYYGNNLQSDLYMGIAVMDGKALAIIPEPISSTLFIIGSSILGFRYFRTRRKTI